MKKIIFGFVLILSNVSFGFEGQIKSGKVQLDAGTIRDVTVDKVDLNDGSYNLDELKAHNDTKWIFLKKPVEASIGDVKYNIRKVLVINDAGVLKIVRLFLRQGEKESGFVLRSWGEQFENVVLDNYDNWPDRKLVDIKQKY